MPMPIGASTFLKNTRKSRHERGDERALCFKTTYMVHFAQQVATAKVLSLEAENGDESSGAVFLGEDGLPACLALAVRLCLGLLKFHSDYFDTFINVGISAEELQDSLASVSLSAFLHVPNRALGEEREHTEEESRQEESHAECESVRPRAVDLGSTEAGHGGGEEAENDDDVSQRGSGAAKAGGSVLGDVKRRGRCR